MFPVYAIIRIYFCILSSPERKEKFMKKRITGVLLSLCLCLTLLPSAVFAADPAPAADTADFTAADGGAAALALLNAAKWENAEPSTWDSGTKTLTLKGLRFVTTAATAVKLPAGATIVLADGTHNTVIGGDAAVTQDGTYHNDIYIYGIYADGDLTIQGGTDRSAGSLTVRSGAHSNTGDAWTYSAALSVQGTLRVEGGETELTGGEARSADCAFSIGLLLPEGSGLSMTGGSLTGTGGESVDTGDEKGYKSFSEGIDLYKGNVSVTGGKLVGKCVSIMDGEGLAYGIKINSGELNISGGEISANATKAIDISSGNLKQTGGEITAAATTSESVGSRYSISVSKESTGSSSSTVNTGNIEITGGELDASVGGIYMYAYQAGEQEGLFTVSGQNTNVKLGTVFRAHKFVVNENATVTSEGITADELMLESGSLTVVEHVKKNEYYKDIYNANAALTLNKLTVNGGTLNASWDWGECPHKVLQYADPLVKMSVASFNGGTTILDTGCAGNTALKTETLKLGSGIYGSGYTHEDSSDTYLQENGSVSVRFGSFMPEEITVTNITAQNKTYDGTDAATLTGGTLVGVDANDNVQLDMTGVTAKFADKAVGTDKNVTVTGAFKLTGADAYKYTLTQPTLDLKASITVRDEFTDATNKTQTIYVGGSSFEAPKFTGVTVNGKTETVTGDTAYTVGGKTTNVKDIGEALKALKAGEKLEIVYTFTPAKGGNYSGTQTGTITVTAQERPNSGGSSSPSYAITLPDRTEHGTVTANRRYAERGDTVTITVKPDSGYVLETLTAMDKNGSELKLTDKGSGKYTFTMPGSRVEVKATFMEDNAVLNFFYDVPNDSFYYEAVKWAVGKNITSGVGDNLFAPDQPCTRAQIVTFLWRAAGSPAPKNMSSFADVPADAFYAKAVAWAVENGITGGTGDGKFSPDATCTRAQAVTFLYRASGAPAVSGNAAFSDVATNAYYAAAVKWAEKNGITGGIGGGLFGSNNNCTRAQIVTFIYRSVK